MSRFCPWLPFGMLVAGLAFCPFVGATAEITPDGIWVTLEDAELDALPKRGPPQNGYVRPLAFRALLLDDDLLAKTLDSAPLEDPAHPMKSDQSDAIIWIPLPDGADVPFSFVEAPIMEPELAEKYPEIRTYLGNALDGSNRYVRFDRTPSGFHALIRGGGDIYIEPGDSDGAYLSYRASDYPATDRNFTCDTEDAPPRTDIAGGAKLRFGGTLRTFRLAVACTGEYANFHGSTSQTGPANAIAAIATVANRVTAIYEQELSVRFVLVGLNDQIVFFDPAIDPFTGNLDLDILIEQSQTVIDGTIGVANYDVGQTFCTFAGGRSSLGVVCSPDRKARGCSGTTSPTGDPFAVSVVCHEIGHQFNADHTFNSSAGDCGGSSERSRRNAFERGSGSTIMSYATAACGADNLQVEPDPYFHSTNLEQISSFLATNACSTNSVTSDSPPTVSAGANFTIPNGTPFTLTAQGSDPDGDPIFYTWEERDKGPAQALIDSDNGKSPLFRCFPPTDIKSRTFPKLADILSGSSTFDELLPSQARTMKFVVVAGHVNGAFATDEMKLTVAPTGPFRVKAPNGGETVQGGGGAKGKITWDVAGSDSAPINAITVRILLSKDGGLTFPILLHSGTPNDGRQKITIPNEPTLSARIKIEAVGNVFWDMSDADFVIEPFDVDSLDITDTWAVRSVGSSDVISHITFFDNETFEECDVSDSEECSEGDFEWNQTGPASGVMEILGDADYTVEIVDDDHLTLTPIGGGEAFTFTRI